MWSCEIILHNFNLRLHDCHLSMFVLPWGVSVFGSPQCSHLFRYDAKGVELRKERGLFGQSVALSAA